MGKLKNGPFWPNVGHFLIKFIIRNVVVVYNVMIYFDFHHCRIYIVLNERVFIIVTDVIDTVLGSITRYISKHG